MATSIITGYSTTAQVLGYDDDLLIMPNATLVTTASPAIATGGSNWSVSLNILGSVVGNDGIVLMGLLTAGDFTTPGANQISVGTEGVVAAASEDGDAIAIAGIANRVVSAGLISATDYAIRFQGNDNYVSNSGAILSTRSSGVHFTHEGSPDTGSELVNSGTIQGFTGVSDSGSPGQLRVTNTGEILGESGGIARWALGSTVVSFELINSGTITGGGFSVESPGHSVDTIVNTGLLAGHVSLSYENDSLRNSGQIIGNLFLGSEDDAYFGYGGVVTGTIYGGSGEDVFHVDDPLARVAGGGGFDTLYLQSDFSGGSTLELIMLEGGGAWNVTDDDSGTEIHGNSGANELSGEGGPDTIYGWSGPDLILGGGDADVLAGNRDDDSIDGGAGNDILNGGAGDDVLNGQSGDDTLRGAAGNDTLAGGSGVDILYGNTGSDVFEFSAITDIGPGAGADRIVDFVSGEDLIDVSSIGDASFSFRGTNGFTGQGAMEIRYAINAAGHAIVQLDADGDGIVDGEIRVLYTPGLTAADFML